MERNETGTVLLKIDTKIVMLNQLHCTEKRKGNFTKFSNNSYQILFSAQCNYFNDTT